MFFAVAIENDTNPKITRKNVSPNINAKAADKEDPKVRQKRCDNVQQITHNEGNHFRSDRAKNNNIARKSFFERPTNDSLKVAVKDKRTSEDQSEKHHYVSPRIPPNNVISKESILRTDKTLIPILKKRPSSGPSPYKPFDAVTPTPIVILKGNATVSKPPLIFSPLFPGFQSMMPHHTGMYGRRRS